MLFSLYIGFIMANYFDGFRISSGGFDRTYWTNILFYLDYFLFINLDHWISLNDLPIFLTLESSIISVFFRFAVREYTSVLFSVGKSNSVLCLLENLLITVFDLNFIFFLSLSWKISSESFFSILFESDSFKLYLISTTFWNCARGM